MTSENKLRYLIDLVDDESAEVRTEIVKQLNEYGFALEKDLKNLSADVVNGKINILTPILTANRMKWMEEHWYSWFNKNNFHEKLNAHLILFPGFITEYILHLHFQNCWINYLMNLEIKCHTEMNSI